MKLQADTDDGRVVLKSEDKQHTVMNLLRSKLWDVDSPAGYDKGHPYIGSSKLVFDSDSPSDDISEAVEKARDDIEEFRDALPE